MRRLTRIRKRAGGDPLDAGQSRMTIYCLRDAEKANPFFIFFTDIGESADIGCVNYNGYVDSIEPYTGSAWIKFACVI